MLQLLVFMLVLALVYVIKAGSVMLQHEELAAKSTALSWARPEVPEEGAQPAWAIEEEPIKLSEPRTVTTLRRQVA